MFWIIAGLVFVGFFFATCVCCGCTQFEDLFTRSDSTSIGTDWTEEAGSWEINGNELRTTSANSIAVYANEPSTDSYTVQVEFESAQNNGTFRIYARQDDENYLCGEVKCGTGGYTKLISCVAGVETTVAEIGNGDSPFWLRFCVDNDAGVTAFATIPVSGSSTGPVNNVVVYQGLPPGKQIAIGVGATLHTSGNVDVESFVIQNYTSACPDCYFACSGVWPRFEVQVELAGFDGTGAGTCNTCDTLHGTYTLTLQGKGRANDYGFGGNMIYMLNIPGSTCGIECIYLTVNSNFGTNNELRIFITQNPWGSGPSILAYTDIQSGYIADPAVPNNNACTEGANTGSTVFISTSTLCDFVDISSVPIYVEFL